MVSCKCGYTIVLLTVSMAVAALGEATQDTDSTSRLSVGPYGSIQVQNVDLSNGEMSHSCIAAFERLSKGWNKLQLAKMLDAFGKPGEGLLQGNFYWFGDFLECQSVPVAKYCVNKFEVNITGIGVLKPSWGVCMPKECSARDAALLQSHLDEVFPKATSEEKYALDAITKFFESYEVANTSTAYCIEPMKLGTGTNVTITFIVILAILLVAGTTVDWYLTPSGAEPQVGVLNVSSSSSKTPSSSHHMSEQAPLNGFGGSGSTNGQTMGPDEPLLGSSKDQRLRSSPPMGSRSRSFLKDIILCFSLPSKMKAILAAKHKQGTIPCLHGLRFFSMAWVVLGHSYYWPTLMGEANTVYAFSLPQRISFQFVLNATFSVDTFFFLSGLLVMYLTLKHLDSNGGHMNWPFFYIHRFLRLTPLYMFAVIVMIYIMPHIGEGPTYASVIQSTGESCRKYWWTNILYINNFHPSTLNDECIGWSWYLAVDMQLFIISPLIILAAYRFRKTGVALVCGSLVLACVVLRAILTHEYNGHLTGRIPSPQDTPTGNIQDIMYTKPYTRIAPYAIGMAVGYALRRMPNASQTIPRSTRLVLSIVGWILTAFLLILPVFGLTHMYRNMVTLSLAASDAYNALSRTCWALGLAILVVQCQLGYGGFVSSILSHPMFIPLSRLTYGAYLFHPFILFVLYCGMGHAFYYTDSVIVFIFLGALAGAYLAAFICAALVEYPLLALESRLVGGR